LLARYLNTSVHKSIHLVPRLAAQQRWRCGLAEGNAALLATLGAAASGMDLGVCPHYRAAGRVRYSPCLSWSTSARVGRPLPGSGEGCCRAAQRGAWAKPFWPTSDRAASGCARLIRKTGSAQPQGHCTRLRRSSAIRGRSIDAADDPDAVTGAGLPCARPLPALLSQSMLHFAHSGAGEDSRIGMAPQRRHGFRSLICALAGDWSSGQASGPNDPVPRSAGCSPNLRLRSAGKDGNGVQIRRVARLSRGCLGSGRRASSVQVARVSTRRIPGRRSKPRSKEMIAGRRSRSISAV
jgi:hypothetical protein